MPYPLSRRDWLSALGATTLFPSMRARAEAGLPTAPVAIAKCGAYDQEVVDSLATMFDQLGGLGRLVEGKTVAIKVNLVSSGWSRLAPDIPVEFTHWTNPVVIGATVYHLGRAGARRIRILECCGESIDSFESYIAEAGWDPNDILNAAPVVEFENTNGLGAGSEYSRIRCPSGGHIFPGFDVNHSYTDCDVFVSIPKMKEHTWFGVTLSMKNIYGITPMNIYGDTAGIEEPGIAVQGTRVSVMHDGSRPPSLSAPQEIDPLSPRSGDYRIPRIVADIVSARPVDLAVIDGVMGLAGGEGPSAPNARWVQPGVLVAGLNPVTTDAVAMAVMGFEPMAERGAPPFDDCDSFLQFAEELGLGTRDLGQIEVAGASIEEVRFPYRQ